MIAAISFIIVILFSLLVIKVGAVALETTGLSKDISEFQAQSAFSGVGFTTSESETLMIHPARRRIMRLLMLMGSAGLTTALATLVLTFISSTGDTILFGGFVISKIAVTLTLIICTLIILLALTRTKWFDKILRGMLKRPLKKLKQKVNLYDYETILGLSKGYGIVSFKIHSKHWMANKKIDTLNLKDEGVVIMGVEREIHGHEEYFGAPTGGFVLHSLDKIVVYARETIAASLSKREKGNSGRISREESIAMEKSYKQIKKIDEEKAKLAIVHKFELEAKKHRNEQTRATKK